MQNKANIRVPRIIELYNPSDNDVNCYGIYAKNNDFTIEGDVQEWHVYARNLNEALGTFFVENEYVSYFDIVDHMEV